MLTNRGSSLLRQASLCRNAVTVPVAQRTPAASRIITSRRGPTKLAATFGTSFFSSSASSTATTGRAEWMRPENSVVEAVPWMQANGVRRALDLGCGVGRHSIFLALNGFTVYALDASANGLDFAKKEATKLGLPVIDGQGRGVSDLERLDQPFIRFHQGAMTNLPASEDWYFDYVLSWNVIYHGDGHIVRNSLKEVNRVLSKGPGLFQASFLTKNNALYGKGTEIAENTFVIPDSDDEDKRHPHYYVDETELRGLLEETGFSVRELREVDHRPSAGHWHWHLLATTRP